MCDVCVGVWQCMHVMNKLMVIIRNVILSYHVINSGIVYACGMLGGGTVLD